MAEKPYRWTVDVEYDWGGRTNGKRGLEEGLPRILEIFKEAEIKGVFFISTEVLECMPDLIGKVSDAGHTIGSHGHFHVKFKKYWRSVNDRKLSEAYLETYDIKAGLFRAPKFYWRYGQDCIYANPRGHAGLLKNMWLGQKIKEETIIYLHPFDIVETSEPAPNLFCKFWYSRPKKASQLLSALVNRYK